MSLKWTSKALSDLVRLNEFLASVDPHAAARTLQLLTSGVGRLPQHPRIGEKLEQYEPREVRRVIVGHYEVRYEITSADTYILRLWHTREDR
jgi:plasmid stabilization system protein ParE